MQLHPGGKIGYVHEDGRNRASVYVGYAINKEMNRSALIGLKKEFFSHTMNKIYLIPDQPFCLYAIYSNPFATGKKRSKPGGIILEIIDFERFGAPLRERHSFSENVYL